MARIQILRSQGVWAGRRLASPSFPDLISCGSLICREKKPIYNFSPLVLNVVAKIQECVCLELRALGESLRKQGLLVPCSLRICFNELPSDPNWLHPNSQQLQSSGRGEPKPGGRKKISPSSAPISCVTLRKLLSLSEPPLPSL